MRSASPSRSASARSMRRRARRSVRPEQRDDAFQQPAVASGVSKRRLLVEDRGWSTVGAAGTAPASTRARRRSARPSRRARRRRSAWTGSRPSRPRGSARGRPASRARSARRWEVALGRASSRADRLRRLEAAHLRHLHVHDHDVEAARAAGRIAATAARPFSTAFTVCPRFCRSVVTSFRFTALSSATRMWSRPARLRVDRTGSAPEPSPGRVDTPTSVASVSSRSECLTGLVR